MKYRPLLLLSLIFFSFVSIPKANAEIIPPDRRIDWSQAGVQGGIPNRTTICITINPSGDASGATDTSNIKTAIGNCPSGQVVKLAAGTFYINNEIRIKSGITVRGSGMGATILRGVSGASGGQLIGFSPSTNQEIETATNAINLSSGYTKGSVNIITSSAHGMAPGDIILIDQLQDPAGDPPIQALSSYMGRDSGTRPIGQLDKVIAVPTATALTLETPLYWNFDAAKTPQIVKVTGVTTNAGIEDMTIDNTDSGYWYSTTNIWNAANCWALRVEWIKTGKEMIQLYGSYRCTSRSR
jgi:hypothetical protein